MLHFSGIAALIVLDARKMPGNPYWQCSSQGREVNAVILEALEAKRGCWKRKDYSIIQKGKTR